ncbi:MAG TPA: T9SS type A sorting domain-containing protein, partial [Bacteroidota bacterium]|nr:T9SS type A sorting domain-containing protein [Bacteroidota bacterium]
KFGGSQVVTIPGTMLTTDTIPISAGWNMTGAVGTPVAVTDISSIPGGIVTSSFFSYNGSYVVADSLRPTRGYWVKANSSGSLVVTSSGASPSNRIRIVPTAELPPPPPGMVMDHTAPVPTEYALGQNYPNPFNPTTVISFALPKTGLVTLKVFNVLGQGVATLVNGIADAGYHSVTLNASELPSGLYFYRLSADTFVDTKKLLLMK